MFDATYILKNILADPLNWGEYFGNPLSVKEEVFLEEIYQELHTAVNQSIQSFLLGDNNIVTVEEKNRVMELSAIQCEVRKLLDTRGGLCQNPVGSN